MRDLINLCEGITSSNFLYHATYRPYLQSIMAFGLGGKVRPKNYEDSVDGVVYLATSSEVAESYAETSDTIPEEYLDQIVILRINTNSLNQEKLFSDKNVIDGTDTYEYRGIISPSSIKFLNDEELDEGMSREEEAEILGDGCWITAAGEILETDYSVGLHHNMVAARYFGDKPSDDTNDDMMYRGWIRVRSTKGSMFTVEFDPARVKKRVVIALRNIEGMRNHRKYYIEAGGDFVEENSYGRFMLAIARLIEAAHEYA